ncbi:rho guanine nucleotide exchange factor 16 isoform X2 [Protopterus annectens]|uniref:rho guanine nucleotide exchange factor 16 isoform X2 n=1 Tax=Protopterus annectens TaxID=7888 RepID=UPI001CFB48C3|nr:rho guanine nucleotide exchange factor 16 isoform X2 [Protopterus annectens]
MSQRHSEETLGDDSPLLVEQKFASAVDINDHQGCNKSPRETSRSSRLSQSKSPVRQESKMCSSESQSVILSTESLAALKLGTQQMIPTGLAVTSKTKQRPVSASSSTFGKDRPQQDSKRMSAPNISLDDLVMEMESCGSLKRNLRNQSYRAAMKGFEDTDGGETVKPLSTLAPVPEGAATQPPRSPGRAKKPIGRKKTQRGSFKDDPRLYQQIRERGLSLGSILPDVEEESQNEFIQVGHPEPDEGIVVQNFRPTQMTWSQLPQVQESGALENMEPLERKRQEAIFEVITSEFSYQHSLNILVSFFKNSEELRKTMTTTDHHHLFSNICDILEASKRFFEELEKEHKKNVVIESISEIVEMHATHQFQAYVVYCSNEVYQQRTLQRLLSSNVAFKETLKTIEKKPECGGLPLISFLILPMQRATRLPLLMDTICQKTLDKKEYSPATKALKAISKLVKTCNEGAQRMERTEQMYTLQKQLEFGKIKSFPVISASRWLLKRGELTVSGEDHGNFRKGFGRQNCYLFLFNDVLIITRKKSEENYIVMDYANLDQVEAQDIDSNDSDLSPSSKQSITMCLFQITMKKNSEGKKERITLAAESLSDKARWISALQYKKQKDDKTTDKEALSQVESIKAYVAKEPDEVSLQLAEVVIVLKEVDGWYQGERVRDGERGWFPQHCAKAITNDAALKQNVCRMKRLRVETDV